MTNDGGTGDQTRARLRSALEALLADIDEFGEPRRHKILMSAAREALNDTTGDQARPSDTGRLDIHPQDIVGNAAVRKIAAYYLGHEWRPVTRPTLLKWRESRGFPEPLPCLRAGVELWDAREVRAWCKDHAARRAELEATYY